MSINLISDSLRTFTTSCKRISSDYARNSEAVKALDYYTNRNTILSEEPYTGPRILPDAIITLTAVTLLHTTAAYSNALDTCLTPFRTNVVRLPERDIVPSPITQFPPAILGIIFSHVDPTQVFSARRVCKAWDRKLKQVEFFSNVRQPLSSKEIALSLYGQYLSYRETHDRYKTRFTKNLIPNVAVDAGPSFACLCLCLLGAYLTKDSLKKQLSEFTKIPMGTWIERMNAYNNQLVSYRDPNNKRSWISRPLKEGEKYKKVEDYIADKKNQLLQDIEPKWIFLTIAAGFSVATGVTAYKSWERTSVQTQNQFFDQLLYPAQLSNDAILRDHIDNQTGRVMLLPIRLEDDSIVDLLRMALPNGEPLYQRNFSFCIDRFVQIQQRIHQLKEANQLPNDVCFFKRFMLSS